MLGFIFNIYHFLRVGMVFLASGVIHKSFHLLFMNKTSFNRQEKIASLGDSINIALTRMGPIFIKLGQVLSTRSDVLGVILSSKLSKLQDKVAPFRFELVVNSIEKEFNKPLSELFLEIEEKAVAAASIAQVHRAVTKEGEVVAVKVLRPHIERYLKHDVALIAMVFKVLTFIIPGLRRYKLMQIVQNLKQSIAIEINLSLEGASADQLRENLESDELVYIPKIIWYLTSKRVLTQEWIDGFSIYDTQKLIEYNIDLKEIVRKLAVSFFNQAYRDGFFHADIHPGNILVDKNGRIVLLDFGIMGTLSEEDRIFIAKTLYGFISRDYKMITNVHFDLGYVPKNQSRDLFMLACRSVGEPIIGLPVNQISLGKLFKQLLEMSQTFDMNIQPKFLLLQKTLITLEGTGYALYPDVNMWKLAEPWIKEWARNNFGVKKQIKTKITELTNAFTSIPKIVNNLNSILGQLKERE